MRVLITGGFGYLGGRLAQLLASRPGFEVWLGSRQPTVSPAWLRQAKTVQMQWHSVALLEQICKGFDAVLHLAGMNAQACAVDPAAAFEFNAGATDRLLQAAVRQKVKRFVYLSTAHVYGSPLKGVITEQSVSSGMHPYSTSNLLGEKAVIASQHRGDIEGVVIRLSNAYGPPVHKYIDCWMLLINNLCRQLTTTNRIELHSNGQQRRDFIPINEVTRALEHLLYLDRKKLGNGIFNVGGQWSPTVLEMTYLISQRSEKILDLYPKSINKIYGNDKTEDLSYRIDKLKESGFKTNLDKMEEIDQLLYFCKKSF